MQMYRRNVLYHVQGFHESGQNQEQEIILSGQGILNRLKSDKPEVVYRTFVALNVII